MGGWVRDGWMGGWVDEGEGKGGAQGYEDYEVKKKREKLRCLLLRRKINFFYIFMM